MGMTEFVASMGPKRVMGCELISDLVRQRRRKPAPNINGRQFGVFILRIFS